MKLLLLILFAGILLTACKKEAVDALPPATQSGANTAGCLVNGNAFVAQKLGAGPGSVEAISGGFSYDSLYYIRFAGKHGNKEATIRLFLRSVRQPKIFLLNQTTTYIPQGSFLTSLNHATYTSNADGKVYVTDAQHTGEVTLTYVSKATGQAAGTFRFTAVNPADRSQTITITDGRFDRKQ